MVAAREEEAEADLLALRARRHAEHNPGRGPAEHEVPRRDHGKLRGAVAIEFYDRRQACPNDASVLPADAGETNFCIDTTLQAYKDSGGGAVATGPNLRVSQFTWDPEQPGQQLDGLSQYPCAGARDPCPTGRGFIGDYFGLAISDSNVYGLFVSTHYPSNVTADEGGLIYYQQQILSTVSRAALGL